MGSWIVSLNSEFVEKYNFTFDSFIIKEEEKEELISKINRISVKIMELTNSEFNDTYLFECKEISEEHLEKTY